MKKESASHKKVVRNERDGQKKKKRAGGVRTHTHSAAPHPSSAHEHARASCEPEGARVWGARIPLSLLALIQKQVKMAAPNLDEWVALIVNAASPVAPASARQAVVELQNQVREG